jgi:hypothetical protein
MTSPVSPRDLCEIYARAPRVYHCNFWGSSCYFSVILIPLKIEHSDIPSHLLQESRHQRYVHILTHMSVNNMHTNKYTHSQQRHSDMLLPILLSDIISTNAKLRNASLELLLQRLTACKTIQVDYMSCLLQLELQIKSADDDVKLELLQLLSSLLDDIDWFTAVLQSSSLIEYVTMNLVRLTHVQLAASSQLSGFNNLKQLLLLQDDFIAHIFQAARVHGITKPAQHFGESMSSEASGNQPVCPLDELRVYVLQERLEAGLDDGELAHSDEDLLSSALRTTRELCRCVCVHLCKHELCRHAHN